MTTTQTTTVSRPSQVPAIVTEFRSQATKMEEQFRAALPVHIPAHRFVRVLMTAVQREPKLLACDRQSLLNAAMQAANDGLLPDGREGVLLPFSSDDEDKVKAGAKVTWVPMVYGLRKKVRNAGVLADWNVQVVQEGDLFDYQLGDEPYIKHKPSLTGGRTRPVIAAYSIAKYPDGTMSFEVMNVHQINDIRKLSRARKGPWANPTFFPEMARKTVARLHSKQLPMSTDLDRVLHRDDALYDFEGAREEQRKIARPGSVAAALNYFGAGGEGEPPGAAQPSTTDDASGDTESSVRQGDAQASGGEGGSEGGEPAAGPPKTAEQYKEFARHVIADAKTAEAAAKLPEWFGSEGQRKMRNACGVTKEEFDAVQVWIKEKIDSFAKK